MSFVRRVSVCWKCRHGLDSMLDSVCHVCGWLICPNCFSCQQYGCFGKVDALPSQRQALRRLHLEANVSKNIDLQEWCIAAIEEADAKAREEEEIRLLALRAEKAAIIQQQVNAELAREREVEHLRNIHCPGTIVSNAKYGAGVVDRYESVSGFEYVYVSFEGSTARFQFPSCYENGFLK